MDTPLDIKTCSNCSLVLDINKFSPTKRGIDDSVLSRNSWCNGCRAKGNRERLNQPERKVPLISSTGKQCLKCNNIKDFRDFSPAERGKLGLSSYCKDCAVRATKEDARRCTKKYRESNRTKYLADHRINQFNRKNKIKALDDGTVTKEFLSFVYDQTICCWCKEVVEEDNRTLEHIVELNNGGVHSATNINMACFSCNSARLNKNSDFKIESLFDKFNKEIQNDSTS